jgi:hypothetical protein
MLKILHMAYNENSSNRIRSMLEDVDVLSEPDAWIRKPFEMADLMSMPNFWLQAGALV